MTNTPYAFYSDNYTPVNTGLIHIGPSHAGSVNNG